MRVFLAGATGAVGRRLGPLLAVDGHDVVGATRTTAGADSLREAGVRRFIAQSYTGWPNTREGGRVKTESTPSTHTRPQQ